MADAPNGVSVAGESAQVPAVDEEISLMVARASSPSKSIHTSVVPAGASSAGVLISACTMLVGETTADEERSCAEAGVSAFADAMGPNAATVATVTAAALASIVADARRTLSARQ